jgi:hypothetical protein
VRVSARVPGDGSSRHRVIAPLFNVEYAPMLSFFQGTSRPRPAGRSQRPRLERLEDRTVPSGFFMPSKVGVVRPTGTGVAQFSLDSNGNGTFDAGDSVFYFGLNSDHFLVGDWNGDGTDKIGVVRPQADGTNIFSLDSNGNGTFDAGDQVFSFGLSSDTILVGDWNGDGRAKIGVARTNADGSVTVSLDSNGDSVFDAGDRVFSFGQAGDKFIVGDWNGDGKAKVGVVRNDGRSGAIVILDSYGRGSDDPNNARFPFGYFSDTFVVGDWNGDGRSKIGVVRPTGSGVAQFSLDTNGDGAFDAGDQVFSFGLNSDTFLTGKWKAPTTSAATPAVGGSGGPTLQGLTVADLQPIIQAAINQWKDAGLDAAHLQLLRQAQVRITQLNGALAVTTGSQISLDSTATGLGWYIDPTPNSSEEYPLQTAKGWQAYTSTAAAKGVDLVTVLAHEMGHVLGLGHSTQTNDVMYASVGPGYRRRPTGQDVSLVPAGGNPAGAPQAESPAPHGSGCNCGLCRVAAG